MHPIQQLPNLRHLRALSLTALHRSVNRAAVEICLSQPAVTQAITKIEAEVGETLFERTRTGMYPSEFGKLFLRRVDRALALLAEATAEAAEIGKVQPGKDASRSLTSAQLRAITAFADHGSFPAAAAQLGVSTLSIQRTASALEYAVGARLLLRSGKGAVLSPAGERIVRGAKLAAREIEMGLEEIEHLRGFRTGRITIGSMPLARVDLVPHAVTGLLRDYPDLRVRMVEGTYATLIAGLRAGDIDVVVGALRNPAPHEDVVERVLFDDPLSVVVRAGHPLARYTELSLAETVGYPWIVPPPTAPTREIFAGLFRSRALMEPKRLVEVGSSVTLRALLVESDRIALVSRRQISFEEEHGLLTVLPIDLPEAHRPIGIALRRDWEPSRTQADLIAELEAAGQPVEGEAEVRRTRKDASRARG